MFGQSDYNRKLTFIEDSCKEVESIYYELIMIHSLAIVVCLVREINEANNTFMVNFFNRFLIVLLTILYISVVANALSYQYAWNGFNFTTLQEVATYISF